MKKKTKRILIYSGLAVGLGILGIYIYKQFTSGSNAPPLVNWFSDSEVPGTKLPGHKDDVEDPDPFDWQGS